MQVERVLPFARLALGQTPDGKVFWWTGLGDPAAQMLTPGSMSVVSNFPVMTIHHSCRVRPEGYHPSQESFSKLRLF
jgi:hypothetical protein